MQIERLEVEKEPPVDDNFADVWSIDEKWQKKAKPDKDAYKKILELRKQMKGKHELRKRP